MARTPPGHPAPQLRCPVQRWLGFDSVAVPGLTYVNTFDGLSVTLGVRRWQVKGTG